MTTRCSRCAAELPPGTRFCTRCGEPLERPAPAAAAGTGTAAGTAPAPAAAQLVHCPSCDAANAASRSYCGRCGRRMDDAGDWPDPVPAEPLPLPEPAAGDTAGGPSGVPAVLLVVTVLATLAIGGVVLTILNARGVGVFAGPAEPSEPGEPVFTDVVRATASSEVPPSGDVVYGPANVTDGDPATAWKEGAAGHGEGEWVELSLAGEVPLVRVLVWNGYQSAGRYQDHGRVAQVRIEAGDRTFTAELLDVEGPQAVDLPETVPTDRVRLTILDVHQGRRYEDTAISGLELYTAPAGG